MKVFILVLMILFTGVNAEKGLPLMLGPSQDFVKTLLKQNLGRNSCLILPLNSSDSIRVTIKDYYYDENGYIAISGEVPGYTEARCMLKGDQENLYGWLLILDNNDAYEFTTNEMGMFLVTQVPVHTIYSVQDFDSPSKHLFTPYPQMRSNYLKRPPPLAPHIGTYPGTDVTKLQSYPDAKKVLYMDITDMMNGDTPKTQTKAEVWLTWAVVAGAYSAFQLNVTTDAAVYKTAGVPNSGILKYLDRQGRSSSGVNIFGTTQYATCFRKRGAGHPDGPYTAGRTGWHESGHVMGTMDYGTKQPATTYFTGFEEFKWVPIMGNFWYSDPWNNDQLQQWCKGDYDNANTKSDMLAMVAKIAPYRVDDIPQTIPLKLTPSGTIDPHENYGQICPTGDSDGFTFQIESEKGHAKILIERTEWIKSRADTQPLGLGGTMLDIDASILDASGKLIIQDNPKAKRDANFDIELGKGLYTLSIQGGAEGTPQKGFSTYGSLGFYEISGEISGGATCAHVIDYKKSADRIFTSNSNGIVTLLLPDKIPILKIRVFSAGGRLLFLSNNRVPTIDLSHYTAGIYFISIIAGDTRFLKKIVKH